MVPIRIIAASKRPAKTAERAPRYVVIGVAGVFKLTQTSNTPVHAETKPAQIPQNGPTPLSPVQCGGVQPNVTPVTTVFTLAKMHPEKVYTLLTFSQEMKLPSTSGALDTAVVPA